MSVVLVSLYGSIESEINFKIHDCRQTYGIRLKNILT